MALYRLDNCEPPICPRWLNRGTGTMPKRRDARPLTPYRGDGFWLMNAPHCPDWCGSSGGGTSRAPPEPRKRVSRFEVSSFTLTDPSFIFCVNPHS